MSLRAEKRRRGPISVSIEPADESIDLERWADRYVELALEAKGILPDDGSTEDDGRRMGPTRPVPVARSR